MTTPSQESYLTHAAEDPETERILEEFHRELRDRDLWMSTLAPLSAQEASGVLAGMYSPGERKPGYGLFLPGYVEVDLSLYDARGKQVRAISTCIDCLVMPSASSEIHVGDFNPHQREEDRTGTERESRFILSLYDGPYEIERRFSAEKSELVEIGVAVKERGMPLLELQISYSRGIGNFPAAYCADFREVS